MRKWLFAFSLECRHLFFQPVFLLLPILFGLWFALDLAAIKPPQWEDIYHFAYDFHKVKHTLSLGIAMLIGIMTVRRDMIIPSYEWVRSYPVSSVTLLTAKFVSGFLYLSLFTLAMSAVYALFAIGRHLTGEEILSYLLFFGLQYEISYAVTLILAMSLAIFLTGRIVYLIGLNAWMFGTLFIDQFIIYKYALYPLKIFHLSQFTLHSFLEHEVWGIPLMERETWLSRFFTLSFILFLFVAMIVVYHLRIRPYGKKRRWAGYAVAALLTAAISFLPYGLMWMDRYASAGQKLKASVSYDEARKFTAFPVESYVIRLTITPDQGVFGDVTMRIPPDGIKGMRQIPLTLNHLFQVRTVTINDKPIPFSRQGDFLLLNQIIPGDPKPISVRITYSGRLSEWSYNHSNSMETFDGYADENRLYLPDRIAWYPIAGKRAPYIRETEYAELSPFSINPFSSHFTVTISGMRNRVFGTLPEVKEREMEDGKSLTFTGKTNILSFYSGQLTEVKIPGEKLAIITSPGNRYEAEKFLKRLSPIKRYFEQWLGKGIHSIDSLFYYSQMLTDHKKIELGMNHIFFSERQYNNLDGDRRSKVVNALLFSDLETNLSFSNGPVNGKDFSLVSEIRLAFYYLYGRDALGLSHQETVRIMEMKPDDKERKFPSPVVHLSSQPQLKRLLEEINKAIAERKMEGIKRVLGHFRSQGLTLVNPDDRIKMEQSQEGGFTGMIVNEEGTYPYPRISWEDWEKVWKEEIGK